MPYIKAGSEGGEKNKWRWKKGRKEEEGKGGMTKKRKALKHPEKKENGLGLQS